MDVVAVIQPELFMSFDELDNLVKSLNKIREILSVVSFLIPDATYEILEQMVSSREHEFVDYSSRRWLTGIVQEPDKFYISKLHTLINRGDVLRVSEVFPECKGDFYESLECFKSDRVVILGNTAGSERLLELGYQHSIRKVKGLGNILILRLQS